ncbi:MAG: bifunctional 3-(3-hydroxy-phenyl)propionate/3-hydroxycinnamic acid hydroxylase [Pseudonocardiaceae bacterium]
MVGATSGVDCEVAIVGGGPVAAVLLALLDRYGVSAIAFEQETEIFPQPRAVGFDDETMRTFQAVGLGEYVAALCHPSSGMTFENESGTILLDWNTVPGRVTDQGWIHRYYFHQPSLERLLGNRLAASGGVELRRGHRVTAVRPVADGVQLSVVDLGRGIRQRVLARWVVGCDGASSLVRECAGARYQVLAPDRQWLVVDAVLHRDVKLPDRSVQYCWPSRPHMYIRLPGPRRRWELMVMPEDDLRTITDAKQVACLLTRFLRPGDADIQRAALYRVRSTLTNRWRCGRLILAGDAAHLQPPLLGQGLCSGIRDVANLAWKLALVCARQAPPGLLDTYESERAPHARAWIEEATRLARILQTTDHIQAAQRDSELLAGDRDLRSIRPPLGPGLHGTAPAPAGTLSIQPRDDSGARLDDVVGLRFAVVARTGLIAALHRTHAQLLGDTRYVAVLTDATAHAAALLERYDRDMVIIRPDRYVLGAADQLSEATQLLNRIPLAAAVAGDTTRPAR